MLRTYSLWSSANCWMARISSSGLRGGSDSETPSSRKVIQWRRGQGTAGPRRSVSIVPSQGCSTCHPRSATVTGFVRKRPKPTLTYLE